VITSNHTKAEPRVVLSLFRGLIELPPIDLPVGPASHVSEAVVERAVQQACAACRCEPKEIWSKSTARRYAHPRQYVMWVLRQIEGPDGGPRYSYAAIGGVFGFDHTTALSSVRAVERRFGGAFAQ
jgi:chromosomal replication initiation ATPase DnaA